jgi:outer membrane protein OmpA-like peptidoglycan-associated protein
MNVKFSIFFIFIMAIDGLFGQGNVAITNGSFEDTPRKGEEFFSVTGWYDCGRLNFPNESPPDLHPGGFWSNNLLPSDGKSYVGLVIRDNESYESISQRLNGAIVAGNCYLFTIDLARSSKYMSTSRISDKEINYVTPAIIKIWAGSGMCYEVELLGESRAIDHEDWRTYQFKFTPKADYKFITIEASWKKPFSNTYCGHVLIDNLSDFQIMDCATTVVPVVNKDKQAITSDKKDELPPHKRGRVDKARLPDAASQMPKVKVLEELDIKKIKVGSIIEVKNLYFKADTTSIDLQSYGVLDEIYTFLKANKNVTIEIGGHTNGLPSHDYCDRLSKARAKAVYDYLIGRGIGESGLAFRGYGKRKSIASDATQEGRLKNQRVELKIISIQ